MVNKYKRSNISFDTIVTIEMNINKSVYVPTQSGVRPMEDYFSDKIDEICISLRMLKESVSESGISSPSIFETLQCIKASLDDLEDCSRNVTSLVNKDASVGAISEKKVANKLICQEAMERIERGLDSRPNLTRSQLMDIIDFLPDATFVLDQDKKVIAWNRALEEMTGFKKMDMIGQGSYAYSIPFYGEPRPILIDLIYSDSSAVRSQYRYVERRGDILCAESKSPFLLVGRKTYIWATASALRDENGEIIGAIESIRDISSRMKAQMELKKSEVKNRSLLDAIPDIIFLMSDDGTFLDCNAPESSSSLYLPPKSFLGKKMQDLMPETLIDEAFFYIDLARETGKMQIFEYELAVNGKLCFFEARINRCGEDAFLVLVRDITENKRSREALCRAKEEAEAAARAKSEFLANMSHEIRTPLNAIIGMTGILLDTPLLSDQKDCLEMVRNSGDMLISLINNILDFSKIEEGMREMEKQPFELKNCIEEAMDLLTPAAAEKYLIFEYKIDESMPKYFIGDATSITQVLINLLGNAVKFTDRGSISVHVSDKILDSGECEVLFKVLDTGIGIPKDRMNSLFLPFSQVDMSTTRKYGGTGLGLAISKKLVDLMGGDIWVESELGRGSTFGFTVILERDLQEGRSTEDELLQGHLPGFDQRDPRKKMSQKTKGLALWDSSVSSDIRGQLKLLLAEDNLVNQKVALLMLKTMGINADVAGNGKEVLMALEQKRYDVILMDVQMPEMDGFEAARAIRKRWCNEQPHIIAVTAYALEGDRERCLEAGMDDYISKPVRLEELAGALGRFLTMQRIPDNIKSN